MKANQMFTNVIKVNYIIYPSDEGQPNIYQCDKGKPHYLQM